MNGVDNHIIYWIWLQCCLGTDSKKLRSAIERYVTPENLYSSDESQLRNSGIFSEREIFRLSNKDLAYSEATAEKCDKLGIDIISYKNAAYPAMLAKTATPPVVLYVKGSLPSQKMPCIGIVGTRNPDETGKNLAHSFGYDLAASNNVVVSGGAVGVDYFAHRGALKSGGRTVCVLGCGIDKYEMKISRFILDNVPEKGAVISEYPPGYPATQYTFPARNRIVSGMSEAIVAVQAGLGSGALITVRFALAQERKVFSVPGNMGNVFCSGTNYLLRCGFSAALCGNDVLSWMARRDREGGNVYVNPDISEIQLKFISTKPEVIELRNTQELSIPSPVSYEIARSISLEDKNAGLMMIPAEQMSFEKADEGKRESLPAESEKKTDSALKKDETEKAEPEEEQEEGESFESPVDDLLVYEQKQQKGDPLYTMDKKTFMSLFEPVQAVYGKSEQEKKPVMPSKKSIAKKKPVHSQQDRVRLKSKKQAIDNTAQKRTNNSGNNARNDKKENKNITEQLTSAAISVYHTISDTPVYTDTIKTKTGLSAGEVLSSLTELELYGYIVRLPGNKYIKKDNDKP